MWFAKVLYQISINNIFLLFLILLKGYRLFIHAYCLQLTKTIQIRSYINKL